VPSS